MRVCSCLSCLAVLASADQVLWDYPMDALPPGWQVLTGDWEFLADGAHSFADAVAYEIEWNELMSDTLVLPPGTDSISISAQQYSITWETPLDETFSLTRMVLSINGEEGIYWNVSQNVTDSLPILVVPPASAGDALVIHLICAANSFPPPPPPPPLEVQATADFHLWDLVVTAHGQVELESASWGAIKSEP
jgi:hypothetical protein